ncbi:MAG: hypothetical protein KDA63_14510 [Planctomycetales bacterium]|nr:hypothetical protein [Planctomycetales bacterium]
MTELEIIEKVRAQPGIYIGHKSLTAFVSFVGGYVEGLKVSGVDVIQDINSAMQEFIPTWYNIPNQYHWSRILLLVCVTEEAAFEEYFRLLDLYLKGVDPITRGV